MDNQTSVHNEFSGGRADFLVQAGSIGELTFTKTVAADPLEQAAQELSQLVATQWRAEAGSRGLLDPVPLTIGWVAAQKAYGDHDRFAGRLARDKAGDLTDFAAAFLRLPRQRLVVLGDPGSGKSSLVILLTLSLLKSRQSGSPVPVLLPIGSWDPEEQHLHTWLADRLADLYPRLLRRDLGGPTTPQRLIEAQLVAPVLDGLDELSPGRRRLALRRLNEALAGSSAPLILTCRKDEYKRLVKAAGVLRSAAVIRARQVRTADALDYLRAVVPPQRHDAWQPVFAALDGGGTPEGPLAEAATSPLMLGMLRSVYRDGAADPARLLEFTSAEELEAHLLDAVVPTAFAAAPTAPAARGRTPRRARRRAWGDAERWLEWLAADLTAREEEDISWSGLQSRSRWSAWVGRRDTRASGRAMLAGLLMLASWVTFGVTSVPSIVFLFGGCAFFIADRPSAARLMHRHTAISLLLMLLAMKALFFNWAQMTTAAVATFMCVGTLTAGRLLYRRVVAAGPDEALDPAGALRLARRRALLPAAGLGLLLSTVMAYSLQASAVPELENAVLSIGTASLGSLYFLARAPWFGYQQRRIRLALGGRLPWRLTAFLRDAHRSGVLRQVGTVYQFRHASLRERLASRAAGEERKGAGQRAQ